MELNNNASSVSKETNHNLKDKSNVIQLTKVDHSRDAVTSFQFMDDLKPEYKKSIAKSSSSPTDANFSPISLKSGDRHFTIKQGNVIWDQHQQSQSTSSSSNKLHSTLRAFSSLFETFSQEKSDSSSRPSYADNSNKVITSRYTWWNFLFLNTLEQFRNVANLYFLGVGVLQCIPAISTTNDIPTMYYPLLFIVSVSGLRSAKEDYDKHDADFKRNGKNFHVLKSDGEIVNITSGMLKAGHIIKIKQDDMIPADCLFLSSSNPKGQCFIDKANLNGETRLEVMNSILLTRDKEGEQHLLDAELSLIYEAPNKHFDTFRGHMTIQNKDEPNKRAFNIDGKSLLMRETILRNTDYILALIVYTGDETKIQRSSLEGEPAKQKRSAITRFVEKCLILMLLLQIALCLLGGILAGINYSLLEDHWYLDTSEGYNASSTAALAFFTWFILLASLLPISLVVSSEMVKFTQSIFLQWDITLYSVSLDKKAKCNSSSIHEDLGRVHYIFSDKTGTLTQNRMEFRYALLQSESHDSSHALMSPSVHSLNENRIQEMNQPMKHTVEFGSKDTEIAKSVRARKAELQQRLQSGSTSKSRKDNSLKQSISASSHSWLTLESSLYATNDQRDLAARNTWLRRNVPFFFRKCWDCTETTLKFAAIDREIQNRSSTSSSSSVAPSNSVVTSSPSLPLQNSGFSHFEYQQILQALWGAKYDYETEEECLLRQQHLYHYMLHMALSNTVKPYDSQGQLKFQAESAEELAMVEFAHRLGFTKRSVNPTVIEITYFEPTDLARKHPMTKTETFQVVATFGFTSKRARVTVIYERVRPSLLTRRNNTSSTRLRHDLSHEQAEIFVMSKGQDTVILPLVSLQTLANQAIASSLKDMSANGLRTLMCAHANKSLSWWQTHANLYQSVINLDASEASEGHPNKCRSIEGHCEQCLQHDAFEKIERDAQLQFHGIIGLEDQLQLLVPECIADCLNADIKVWMITGDKLDTAKNIGLACNLIDADMLPQLDTNKQQSLAMLVKEYSNARLLEVTGQWTENQSKAEALNQFFKYLNNNSHSYLSVEGLRQTLRFLDVELTTSAITAAFGINDLQDTIKQETFVSLLRDTVISSYEAVEFDIDFASKAYNRVEDHVLYPVSMLIDRTAFQVLFPSSTAKKKSAASTIDGTATIHFDSQTFTTPTDEDLECLRAKIFSFTHHCKSVVFARAEPAMKKRMVTEIQARVPEVVTLAIGDGANDSDMIKAASIGVGIAGVEGSAASQSADYAIGSFRHLHTLLFVHGYWSNQRISKLVTFIFYKACLVAIAMFLFGVVSAFSGQQFFDDPIYQIYNVTYTALPIIALAILDQPLPSSTLQTQTQAYRHARDNPTLTVTSFLAWILRAFFHAVILFWIPYATIGETDVSFESGLNGGLWFFSTIVYMSVAIVANLIVLFEMVSISLLQLAAVLFSIVAIFLVDYVVNSNLFEFYDHNLYSIVNEIYACPNAWLTILLTVSVPLLIETLWRAFQREFWPTMAEVLAEMPINNLSDKLTKNNDNITGKTIIIAPSSTILQANQASNSSAEVIHSQPTYNLDANRRMIVKSLLRFLATISSSLDRKPSSSR